MNLNLDQKQKLLAVLVGLFISLLHLYWSLTSSPGFADLRNRLNWLIYDFRFTNVEPDPFLNDTVVIIDLDEKSQVAEGRWPWPRKRFAELLAKLHEAGVAVTALDIMFTDRELNPADLVRDANQELGAIPIVTEDSWSNLADFMDGDQALVEVLSTNEIVVGYSFAEDSEHLNSLPPEVVVQNDVDLSGYEIPEARAMLANLAVISDAAISQGFFSVLEDADGVLRHYNMLYGFDGKIYPSLALEAVRLFNFLDGVEVEASEEVLEAIDLGGYRIPVDNQARALIPFQGEQGAFRYFSATDILQGNFDPLDLEGRIAFVGSTSKATFDFISTPVQPNYPGLEVHATIASGILNQNFKSEPAERGAVSVLMIALIGITLSLLLPYLRPLVVVAAGLGLLGLEISFNWWMWNRFGIALDMALALVLTALLTTLNIAFGFVTESRAKQQVTGMFGQYVPPDLVKQMSQNPEHAMSFEGARRDMTVLFADIRDFTSMSEGMEPTELKDMLNRYLTPMTKIIFEHQGTIDKYIGDMVMAFWGAPIEDPNHARHGVQATLQMLKKTQELRSEFAELGYPQIRIGVGLNSGLMNVGNMGSEYRRSYTVLGDNVNLGSRCEGLTKYYGVNCLITEKTYQACGEGFVFRRVDKVQVKGREDPVMLYQAQGREGHVDQTRLAELAAWEESFTDYLEGDWARAHDGFTALAADFSDMLLYQVFRDRTAEKKAPKQWTGVFRHDTK